MKAKRILINKKADFKKLLRQLKDADVISLDTETSDLFRTSMLVEKVEPIVGFCFATREGEGYYIPIRHNFGEQLDADYVIKELKKILEDPSKSIGGHNIKYDLMVCRNEGIDFKPSWDSMLETHLAGDGVVVGGSREKLGLKDLAADKFNIRMKKLTDYFGTKKKIDMAALDITSATEYAAADPDITLRLHNLERPKVKGEMLYRVEMLLIPIVLDMEMKGIQLDLPFMAKEKERLLAAAEMTRKMIMDYLTEKLGYEVDINLASTQQVGDMFHDKLGIPAQGKTPTGRYCTSDDVYEGIRDDYPIIHNLLTLRTLKKAANDFYGGYADEADCNGILRTTYNLIGASSGRFSSSDPNAQNVAKFSEWFIKLMGSNKDAIIKLIEKEFKIKIDAIPTPEEAFTVLGATSDNKYEWVLLKSGEVAMRIDTKRRKAFIARPGKKLVEPDYDQIESKVLGAMAGEKKLLAQFARMEDIHSQVASEMLGIPISKITKKLREIGKAFNHAIPYGISEFGVARRLKTSVEEAEQHLNSYFAVRPAIKAYIDRNRDKARITKKVTTFFGRIQPVPEFYGFGYKMMLRGERACINRIIQGTSADILKIAMVREPKRMVARHGDKVDMLLTNHDALMFEVDEDVPDNDIIKSIIDIMTFGIKGFPLFTVSIKKGDNWAEMKGIWGAEEWKEMIKLWSLDKGNKEVNNTKNKNKKAVSYNKADGQKITVSALSGITKEQAKKLVALLDNNAGSNTVVLVVNDFRKILDKHLTSLSIQDADVFKAVFPCRVSVEKSEVKVKELLK